MNSFVEVSKDPGYEDDVFRLLSRGYTVYNESPHRVQLECIRGDVMPSNSYGVVVITPDHTRVLMTCTADGKYWGFPKGHRDELNPDEPDAHAAARETFEETGIRVDPARLDPFRVHTFKKIVHLDQQFIDKNCKEYPVFTRYTRAGDYHRSIKFYIVEMEVDPRDIKPQAGEVSAVRLVTISDALRLVSGSDQSTILEDVIADYGM